MNIKKELETGKRIYLVKADKNNTITYYFRNGRIALMGVNVVWNKEKTMVKSRKETVYKTLDDMVNIIKDLMDTGYRLVEDN